MLAQTVAMVRSRLEDALYQTVAAHERDVLFLGHAEVADLIHTTPPRFTAHLLCSQLTSSLSTARRPDLYSATLSSLSSLLSWNHTEP